MHNTIHNPELKETITFIKTSKQTNGKETVLKIALEPGGGNPLHYHTSYSETFTAIEGTLGLELKAGKKLMLKPGESYLVKANEVHRFFNPGSTKIRFRNDVHPGHQGFENTLRILCGLANDGLYNNKGIPKNFAHLAICGVMSDMRLPGLMSLTMPMIQFIAARARKKGVEAELLRKYCSGA